MPSSSRFRALVPLFLTLAACGGGELDDAAAPTTSGAAGAGGAAGSKTTTPATLDITAVSVTQVADVVVMKGGLDVTPEVAPVVEGRGGQLRVHVRPGKGWTLRPVVATLTLTAEDGSEVTLTGTQKIQRETEADEPKSSINVELPAERMKPGASYRVVVTTQQGDELARHPKEGSSKLPVEHVNDGFSVVLVPFRYDADGSGRLPDVDSLLQSFRDRMWSMYPAPTVEVSVHEPVPYPGSLTAYDDDEWGAYLEKLLELREAEGAAPNVYYYAIMAPRPSFFQFCGGGCIAGLATGSLGKKTDPSTRGAVGVGYDEDFLADTFVHEIGHTHGLLHAPCGNPASIDKKFPYAGGGIGTVGWDALLGEWHRPDEDTDVMSYCHPQWISDYAYGRIAREMQLVAASSTLSKSTGESLRVRVAKDGGLVSASARLVAKHDPAWGEARSVRVKGGGPTAATFVPFADAKGGFVYLPKGTPVDGAKLE